MIIDLSADPAGEIQFEFESVPDLNDDAARIDRPLAVTGTLRTSDRAAELDGQIRGTAMCLCTRCLAPVEVTLDIAFRDVFVTPEMFGVESESEVAKDDLDVSVLENESLDLDEVVREQVLLNLPEQVLCRAECRGICPHCGADLNASDCGCEKKDIDPRWSGLKDLKL